MYATKRRRRSLKSNNKGPALPQKSHDGCNGSSSSLKSNPSKRHRERLNTELERLASLLPFDSNILSKLDKLSILRLSASYLRIKSYFQAVQHHEAIYSSYDAPAGIAHQHVTKSLDHFPFDPSLLRTDAILKALNGFVMVMTRDGDVFYASSNVEEFLGFNQSDVIHQKVAELIHSEDRHELEKQLSLNGSHQRATAETSLQDHFQNLERCMVVRFRCLLDNTSGFVRFEVRGRMGALHGQNCPTGEIQLGLLAVCTPFGPPSLLETASKDSMFKSKHKLDFTLINIDSKGKSVLGFDEEATPNRHFYNWIHPDDLQYASTAHKELKNTSSCGLLAYRVTTKSSQWQWLQTSMRTIFKSGKADHVTATHRPLQEEEGRDLYSKRASGTKLDDLDGCEQPFAKDEPAVVASKPPKPKKRASLSSRDISAFPAAVSSRRSKFVANDGYPVTYSDTPSLPGSMTYCGNPYSGTGVLDTARLFSTDSFIPYTQFGSTCYTTLPTLPDSVAQSNAFQNASSGILDNARIYDLYAYQDSTHASGDYLKNYYKGTKMFLPTMDVSRTYGQYPDATTSAYHVKPHSAWMPHHRKSVVVFNGYSNGYSKSYEEGEGAYAAPSSAAHVEHTVQDENEVHGKPESFRKTTSMQAANFSIAEATQALLN